MDQLQKQAIVAVLDDLRLRIAPVLRDPTAIATLDMGQHLLAYLLARRPMPLHVGGTIAEELQQLEAEECEENTLIQGRVSTTGFQALTAELLEPYLQKGLRDENVRVTGVNLTLGGFSKMTYIVDLSGADAFGNRLVVRRDAEFPPTEFHAAEELPVLQVMHRHGVAVAEPLWADDPSPFGGSLLVSRCVSGHSVYEKSGRGMGDKSVPAALALARVVAHIHQVPIAELGLPPDLARAPIEVHVGRIIDGLKEVWQRRRLWYSPTIEAAFAWVRANIPRNGPDPTIVHGDASLRNFLVEDGEERALLDWELWHIGDPTEDLELCKPEIELLMPWDRFMAEYRAHGGCAYDPAIGDYYGLLIALWQAVNTGCAIEGFVRATIPELRTGFVGTYHYRRLVREVARRLSALSA